jgi:uncharacterized membrane protein YfcA
MRKRQIIKLIICVVAGIPAGIILNGYIKDPSSFKFSENLTYFLLILSMIFLFTAYSKKEVKN